MEKMGFEKIFTQDTLSRLFPDDRADLFFEGLYGDLSEGDYDITLIFKGVGRESLNFEFQLKQRPGKCLACNVTYGLPEVFSRHPVINIKGLVKEIDQLLDGRGRYTDWRLGQTKEVSSELHVVPLMISMAK